MMFARWTATVFTLRSSFSAIARLDRPSQMSCSTSSSRGVRPWLRSPFGVADRDTLGSSTVSPAATRLTARRQVEVERVLEHVAARAGFERLPHQRVLAVHAEHQDRDVGLARAGSRASPQPARAGHGAVHHDDARLEAPGQPDRFVAVAGLADHDDVGVVFEQAPEAAPHEAWSSASRTVILSVTCLASFPCGTCRAAPACRPSPVAGTRSCRRPAPRARASPTMPRPRAAWRRRRAPCRDPRPPARGRRPAKRRRTQARSAPEWRATLLSASCSTR